MKLTLIGTALLSLAFSGTVFAQGTEIFKDADLALGEKLIAEHKCAQCHASKVGGDGSAMYKPKGKFNNAGLLRGMVEMCNTQMNLGMFPEEVTAVAAVLNRDHYKFK
jgi:mono/diheme cytochrome c family protein